jgi:hypothetical protein
MNPDTGQAGAEKDAVEMPLKNLYLPIIFEYITSV